MYSSCIECSSQFRFCGNPFRVDLYQGCSFGCKYCFANSSLASNHNEKFDFADIEFLQKLFYTALETDKKVVDAKIELLRHRVPLHCGGMSDPFQPVEFEKHLTYKLIELSNKYNYPISFSTKTAYLPEEYFEILNPAIHAFQISMCGFDDDFIRKYETNTPPISNRVTFLHKLRARGFWCSIRIQPLIDIQQTEKLIEYACNIDKSIRPSYITVEHLKIPQENKDVRALFADELSSGLYSKSKSNFRNIEKDTKTKEEDFARVVAIANKYGVLVGCGDNDLHHLSQSRCCCGIDTINENFDEYLKCNLTYFVTGDYDLDTMFKPSGSYNTYLNSRVRHAHPEIKTFFGWVKEYIRANKEYVLRSGKTKILTDLGIENDRRLF